MRQKDFGFLMLWDRTKTIDEEVIESFESDHEAMKYDFDHRDDPNGRTVAWLASRIGVQRQRLSRMLNHGDFKLAASKVHLFDFYVGNSAYSQFIEMEKNRFKKRRIKAIQKAIEEKVA